MDSLSLAGFDGVQRERLGITAAPTTPRAGSWIRPGWLRSPAITVRLRESRVDLARRILRIRLSDVAPAADDGWRLMTVSYSEVESVRQLLQFGDHIEVLAPERARQRISELATDLASRHRSSASAAS